MKHVRTYDGSDSMHRIGRRLALQHARWLLMQPIKDGFWFRTCRSIRRGFRRFLILIYSVTNRLRAWFRQHPTLELVAYVAVVSLVSIMALAIAITTVGLVFVLPSFLLQVSPARQTISDDSGVIAFAFTRLAILLSAIGVFMWCLLPGSDRNVLVVLRSAGPAQGKRRYSFLRKRSLKRGAISPRTLPKLIGSASCVVMLAAGGVMVSRTNGMVALAMGLLSIALFVTSLAWMFYRVSLRMMRHRSKIMWKLSLYEYLTLCCGFVTAGSLIFSVSPEIVRASSYLKWFGPIGYAMSSMRDVALGDSVALVPVIVTSGLNVVVGWWIGHDEGSWTYRRQRVSAQRLVNRADVDATKDADVAVCADLKQQIRCDLDRAIRARRQCLSAAFTMPLWFRRRQGWYWMIGAAMCVFVLVLAGIRLTIDQFEPVPMIGRTAAFSPVDRLTVMFLVPFIIVLICTESMALGDRWFAVPVVFQERPRSPWRFVWELHRDGITRLPVQMMLSLPFAVLFVFGGTPNVDLLMGFGTFLLSTIGLLLAMRTILASHEVLQSVLAISNRWVALAMQCVLGAASALIVIFMILFSDAVVKAEVSSLTYHLGVLFANALALVLLVIVIDQRRKHAEPIAAKLG